MTYYFFKPTLKQLEGQREAGLERHQFELKSEFKLIIHRRGISGFEPALVLSEMPNAPHRMLYAVAFAVEQLSLGL